MELPLMYRARLKFSDERVADPAREVRDSLVEASFLKRAGQGGRIGVTVGSRGIKCLVPVVQAVVRFLEETGFCPVIIPAMGSHGGGTAEGQREVLASLGITPESMGVPVMACGEAVQIGEISPDLPVYVNRETLSCDGIVVVNRVKPHTSFHGPVESGLMKMLAVGLGNPQGAAVMHKYGPAGLRQNIPRVAGYIIKQLPVLFGVAIVENAYDQPAIIAGVEPEDFYQKEQLLLEKARSLMPSLPFDDIDLLVVGKMGKCYSGTGMDTNVIGRLRIQGEPDPERPRIKRIAVLDLDERSGGNATGIGLADFTTDRLLAKVNWEATYLNVLNTTFVQRAMVPVHFPDDREVVTRALDSLGVWNPREVRVVVIKNTLELEELAFSEALLNEALTRPDLMVDRSASPLSFRDGYLELNLD